MEISEDNMAKSNMDVLEEWVNIIYNAARKGYDSSTLADARLCFEKIKGSCEVMNATLKCCKKG